MIPPQVISISYHAFFGIWLIYCAWYDWRTRQIPNWLIFPAIGIGLVLRLTGQVDGPWQIVILICATAFTGWAACLIGGGDAKVTIVMALVNPYMAILAWIISSLWYAGLRVYLLFAHRKEEIRLPGAPGFALGGIFFLFLSILRML